MLGITISCLHKLPTTNCIQWFNNWVTTISGYKLFDGKILAKCFSEKYAMQILTTGLDVSFSDVSQNPIQQFFLFWNWHITKLIAFGRHYTRQIWWKAKLANSKVLYGKGAFFVFSYFTFDEYTQYLINLIDEPLYKQFLSIYY